MICKTIDNLEFKRDKDQDIWRAYLQIGEYKVQRYCPHQKYDLKYHGVVNEDEKTITCLGHGWEWKLNSGEGVNTRCKLKCFKKNRTV